MVQTYTVLFREYLTPELPVLHHFALACLLLAPVSMVSQANGREAGRVVMRGQQDRWVHAGQLDGSIPLDGSITTIRIDSIRSTTGSTQIFVTQSNQVVGIVTFDTSGVLRHMEATLLPAPSLPFRSADSVRFELARRFENMSQMDARLWLPEARLWPITLAFRPERLVPGASWIDTVRLSANDGELFQSLEGIRHSIIMGDTLVDGETLWLVRDSALVRSLERFPTIDREALREREVSGVVIGRTAWDPETRMPRWRHDSFVASGTVRDRLHDGRVIETAARHERFRRMALFDAAATRDSFTAWSRAMRSVIPRPSEGPRPSELLARSDTAAALRAMTHGGLGYRTPINEDEVRVALLALDNPERALSWETNSTFLAGDILQRLLSPVPALTADTAAWRCEPMACRLLAEAWPAARERELRSIGLAGRFALDPRIWADTLLTRVSDDPELLTPFAWLIRGVGATWPAASHAPLPDPGSGWREWVEWMDGRNPEYAARPGTVTRDTTTPTVRMRFEASHTAAIRMRELLTGRDVREELVGALDRTTDDTARAVFRFLLTHLGHPQEPAAVIAARVDDPDPAIRGAAIREAHSLLHTAPTADSASTLEIQTMLLEAAIDGQGPWSVAQGAGRPLMTQWRPRAGDSVYIEAWTLHPDVRARWASFGTMVLDSGWTEPTDRFPVTIYQPSAVTRVGPLARIRFGVKAWVPGARGAPSPGAFMTEYTIDLLWTGEQWQVINTSQWIT